MCKLSLFGHASFQTRRADQALRETAEARRLNVTLDFNKYLPANVITKHKHKFGHTCIDHLLDIVGTTAKLLISLESVSSIEKIL